MEPEGQRKSPACATSEEKQPVRRRRLPASFRVAVARKDPEEQSDEGRCTQLGRCTSCFPTSEAATGGDDGETTEEEDLPMEAPGFVQLPSLRREDACSTKYGDRESWRGTPFCLDCTELVAYVSEDKRSRPAAPVSCEECSKLRRKTVERAWVPSGLARGEPGRSVVHSH